MKPEAGYEAAFSPGEIIADITGLQWEVVRCDIPEPGVHYILKSKFPHVHVATQGVKAQFRVAAPRWIVKQCDRRKKP